MDILLLLYCLLLSREILLESHDSFLELLFACLSGSEKAFAFYYRTCVLHCFSNIRLIGYSSLTNL